MVDVVFSPYFTKNINFHQHDSSNKGKGGSVPDDYNQMKLWYESVLSLKLDARVFHNELSPEFIAKYETDKVKFVKWDQKFRPSYNDERFYAYHDYLSSHGDIGRVFCTDLYDVVFCKNPFRLVDLMSGYDIFTGSELINLYSSRWMNKKCKEMSFPTARKGYAVNTHLYNAGIIGGSASVIKNLFASIIQEFEKIDKKFNANMPVYNYCLENLLGVKVMTGHPLHNVFNSNVITNDTYIKHK